MAEMAEIVKSGTWQYDGSGATFWAHDKMGRATTEKRTITGSSAITNSVGYSYNLEAQWLH